MPLTATQSLPRRRVLAAPRTPGPVPARWYAPQCTARPRGSPAACCSPGTVAELSRGPLCPPWLGLGLGSGLKGR
eukprot:scaffold34227_cov51-Phaeocystis_antarctica.AAC.1